MILLIITLFSAIVILSCLFRKHYIVYPVLLKTLGLLIILFSLVEYIIKLSTYVNLFPFEYSLYMALSKLRLFFRHIVLLENIGFSVFMFGNIIYFAMFRKNNKLIPALMCIPIILRFYISSLSFGEKAYLFCHSMDHPAKMLVITTRIVTSLQLIILVINIAIPYFVAISNIKATQLLESKRNSYYSLLPILATDIISCFLIFISDFRYFSFLNLDLTKYPTFVPFRINNNVFIAITFIVMMIFIVIGLIRYTPLKQLNPNYNSIEVNSSDENIIMLLHTYKNAFCAISQYADIQNSFLTDNELRLRKVKDISDKQFQELSNIINIARGTINQTISPTLINVADCIETALTNTLAKNHAEVIKKYYNSEVFTLGNQTQIIEAFVCLIQNSIDAMSFTSKPTINISLGIENNKLYINFTDNGEGIKFKDKYKIFNPLFSSKMGGSNLGMGLTYAKRIIESHGGSISLRSKCNKSTTFQVVLPAITFNC